MVTKQKKKKRVALFLEAKKLSGVAHGEKSAQGRGGLL